MLKPARRRADPWAMRGEVECPICDADVPLTGDEKAGEEVFCPFCRAPLAVRVGDDEEIELEEDL